MSIFLASASGLACTFYVYVLIQFLHDKTHIPHGLSTRSEPVGRVRDCTAHLSSK
jgi:hypothetical protein